MKQVRVSQNSNFHLKAEMLSLATRSDVFPEKIGAYWSFFQFYFFFFF